jgi:hypothetical protein
VQYKEAWVLKQGVVPRCLKEKENTEKIAGLRPFGVAETRYCV